MTENNFIDRALITVRAGNGGNGAATMRREKHVPFGGPDGGDGGRGGSVYLRAERNLNTLLRFRYERKFDADSGLAGAKSQKHGKKGQDLYILVPPGTIIRLVDENGEPGAAIADLAHDGDEIMVARGGRGGLGNQHFATSTNQAPRFAQKGEPGEEATLALELKLIADVGLLGYPNVGKSTFLAAVTAAKPKIGDYPFTTLTPNLGVVDIDSQTFVIADIPGLIEGAHLGVGLGHDFLRHVERTRVLLHLVDGTSEDPAGDVARLNQELELYDPGLGTKPQIIVVTKTDIPEVQERLESIKASLAGPGRTVYAMSSVTGDGVQTVLRAAMASLAEQASREGVRSARTIRTPLPRLPDEDDDASVETSYLRAPGTDTGLWEEPETDFEVLRPRAARSKFHLLRQGGRTYQLAGDQVERMVVMTELDNEQGYRFLLRQLEKLGVPAAIERANVPIGAKITIGETDFLWTDIGLRLPPAPVKKYRTRRQDS